MGLFNLFDKKERFSIRNKDYIIINKSYCNKLILDKVNDIIYEVLNSENIVKKLPGITFILNNKNQKSHGSIKTYAIMKGKVIIRLNIFDDIDLKSIKFTLLHELAHAWDYMNKSNILKSHFKFFDLSFWTIDRKIMRFREVIHIYFSGLKSEGLAIYYEGYKDCQVYDRDLFFDLYNMAYSDAKHNKKIFNEILHNIKGNNKELYTEISYHTIGFHMFYSIIYLNLSHNMEFNALAKMGYAEFIRKYELTMWKFGYAPIISLNSGRGIIVYTKLLNEWAAVAKNEGIEKF